MDSKRNWLDRPIHPALPAITNEIAVFAVIMIIAIATRFYNLGARVMSHDESLHTYFSWLLYRGQGYEHTPMMHGPLQFHLIALSYFMFGASDFTARIPAVIFSLLTISMAWYWRRFIGRSAGLIAGVLMVISPFMLYYGRYVREDIYAVFSGVLMLYLILRYLEAGKIKYLFMLAGAIAIHFLDKETSFMYTAMMLIYLAVYFIVRVTRKPWENDSSAYRIFVIALAVAILFGGIAGGIYLVNREEAKLAADTTGVPANPDEISPLAPAASASALPELILGAIALGALIVAAIFLIRGYTWERVRNERSFDLLMVFGTIVLPQLSPLPISLLGKTLNVSIPTTAPEIQALAGDTRAILIIGGFLVLMFILAILAGMLWNIEKWWKTSLIFWVPFILLYTSIFSNPNGFFTGAIGSLGYWIVQHDVQRGSQPFYYYLLVQIPIYEFLPALGFFLALYLGFTRKRTPQPELAAESTPPAESTLVVDSDSAAPAVITQPEPSPVPNAQTEELNFVNTFSLLLYWVVASVAIFSFAGERMPWLTIHMSWPLILMTSWALGRIIDTTNWEALKEKKIPLGLAAVTVFVASLGSVLYSWNSAIRPFQGTAIEQLQATNAFLLPFMVMIVSAGAMVYLLRAWTFRDVRHIFTLVFFGFLTILTVRASFRASYITYDQATEFLVYAHGARGIKDVIEQAQEISYRTTGGMNVAIAYDASAPDTGVSWPFVWYLRDFTNQRSFDQPTRSLRESVVIIVDEKNFDKIEPAIGPGYYRMDYIRMWWPMQDYFNLVSDRDPNFPFDDNYACKGALSFFKLIKSKDYSRFCEGFTDPAIRAGIFQIWLNRDYTQYAQAKGRSDLDIANWQPADQMRLYIRQDVASQIWNYGVAPTGGEIATDPTEGKYVQLPANLVLGVNQATPLFLNAPRSLAFASDGTMYVADSRNHRIVHLDVQGNVLNEWGTFADGINTPVGDGTFNEPWGIAVGPDGSVYVADTWNHRIEKFTSTGRFVKAWGTFGQGETPDSFYGPRGLAVDAEGRVYVTDTGNKRIVVFDADGNYVTEFGGAGFDPGLFDEPTSVAIDRNGTVYVTDTWNQRIQTFTRNESADGLITFLPEKQWDVFGWFGQSLDNKPFIAVNDDLHVFVTDPEGYRVIEFDPNGEIVRVWGDYSETELGFSLASGIAVDPEGNVWVTDGVSNRVMRFTLP